MIRGLVFIISILLCNVSFAQEIIIEKHGVATIYKKEVPLILAKIPLRKPKVLKEITAERRYPYSTMCSCCNAVIQSSFDAKVPDPYLYSSRGRSASFRNDYNFMSR
jgi:hypothetical protein